MDPVSGLPRRFPPLGSRRDFLTLAGALALVSACGEKGTHLPPKGSVKERAGNLFYGYADRFIDYGMYERSGYWLRGPDPGPLPSGKYVAFAGAAQTFGRFVHKPFPDLVSNALPAPCLNLGIGGVGPSLFTQHPLLLEWINSSRFLILQVMSGRSAYNSEMQGDGRRKVRFRGRLEMAEGAWDTLLKDAEVSPAHLWDLVRETRENWVADYLNLIGKIRVPIVLFYIGARALSEEANEDHSVKPAEVSQLFGGFPQMVTRTMVSQVASRCTAFVESVTDIGLPMKLPARVRTGAMHYGETRWKETTSYYPSPEMHAAAAKSLIPVCRPFWEDGKA